MGDNMKKSIVTIIILAIGILNMVMTAVIVFAVVPTTMRTNNLISKVASAIELELEPTKGENDINIEDIEVYQIADDITINLKKEANDAKTHYALVSVSLSINEKSEDFKALEPTVATNESKIKEIIADEFSKYTVNNVTENKEQIKINILKDIQEYFKSDFIVSISVGKLVVE
jgi:flagellar basal body-associated protein FliL